MSNTKARASFPSVFAFSTLSNRTWWNTSTNTSTNMSTQYVYCAGITKIMPPKYTRAFVDITDMNSTDYYEDSALAGPIRTGTVGFEANYLSTNTQQKTDFETAFAAGTPIGWHLTIAGTSSGNVWYGDGVISAYSMGDLTMDGKDSMTFELKTKGKPVGPIDSSDGPAPSATTTG